MGFFERVFYRLRYFLIPMAFSWITKLLVWGQSFGYEGKVFAVIAGCGLLASYILEGRREHHENVYKEKVEPYVKK